MFGLINPNKLNLEDKLNLLNLNNLSLSELRYIKTKIDYILENGKFNDDTKLEFEEVFGEKYKKIIIFKKNTSKIEFIVREDGIALGCERVLFGKFGSKFYIGKVDKLFNLSYIGLDDITSSNEIFTIIKGQIKNVTGNIATMREEIIYISSYEGYSDAISVIDKICDIKGSNELYNTLPESEEIYYNNELERNLSILYSKYNKNAKFRDLCKIILNSENNNLTKIRK